VCVCVCSVNEVKEQLLKKESIDKEFTGEANDGQSSQGLFAEEKFKNLGSLLVFCWFRNS